MKIQNLFIRPIQSIYRLQCGGFYRNTQYLQQISGIITQKKLTLKQIISSLNLMDQSDLIQPNISSIVEENTTLAEYLYFLLKVTLIILILVLFCKRKKRDLKKQNFRVASPVPIEKIVVAIEIKDFFINLQDKLKPGYEPLDLPMTDTGLIMRTLQTVLGYKPSIKLLYSIRQITQFVKGLKNVKRIELMLYTSLSPQISDAILRKLKLSQYFPPENRKFCDPKQVDMMKHAIDVDKESRRVIIITPSKKDHNWEDEKYFLIQNPKNGNNKNLLKDCLRNVKTLVEENESFDTLHDELAQLKIDVQQSDFSDFEREVN